jgi:hypothetical protein
MPSTFPGADAQEHSEGQVAKTIERETAKLPSDTFLWLAIGSMIVSATMQLAGKKHGSSSDSGRARSCSSVCTTSW